MMDTPQNDFQTWFEQFKIAAGKAGLPVNETSPLAYKAFWIDDMTPAEAVAEEMRCGA